MLICGDVIRPGLAWMLTRTHRYLASAMTQIGDPDGFTRLRTLVEAEPVSSRMDARIAAARIATLLACKGGTIAEITVGDCVELVEVQRRTTNASGELVEISSPRRNAMDELLRLRAFYRTWPPANDAICPTRTRRRFGPSSRSKWCA